MRKMEEKKAQFYKIIAYIQICMYMNTMWVYIYIMSQIFGHTFLTLYINAEDI